MMSPEWEHRSADLVEAIIKALALSEDGDCLHVRFTVGKILAPELDERARPKVADAQSRDRVKEFVAAMHYVQVTAKRMKLNAAVIVSSKRENLAAEAVNKIGKSRLDLMFGDLSYLSEIISECSRILEFSPGARGDINLRRVAAIRELFFLFRIFGQWSGEPFRVNKSKRASGAFVRFYKKIESSLPNELQFTKDDTRAEAIATALRARPAMD